MLIRNEKEIKNIYVNGKKVLKVYNQGKVLYDSRIERKTVSGKELKIDDGMSEYTGKLEILGNSEQETRIGKNLLNPTGSGSYNGITLKNNNDGSFTISGT